MTSKRGCQWRVKTDSTAAFVWPLSKSKANQMARKTESAGVNDQELLNQWLVASPSEWKPTRFQIERELLEEMLNVGEQIERVFTANSITVLPAKEFLRGVVISTDKRIIVIEKGHKRNRKRFDSRYSEIEHIVYEDKLFGASVDVIGLESYRIRHVPDQSAAKKFVDFAGPRATLDRDAFHTRLTTPATSAISEHAGAQVERSPQMNESQQDSALNDRERAPSAPSSQLNVTAAGQQSDAMNDADKLSAVKADRESNLANTGGPNPNTSGSDWVSVIRNDVSSLLTPNERIERIAHQNATALGQKRDAVVCTNNRLIIYRGGWFGKLTFEDFLWQDVIDAHLKEGSFSSTLLVNTKAGPRSLSNCFQNSGSSFVRALPTKRARVARATPLAKD